MEQSRWWYVLIAIAILNVIWSLIGVVSGERITVGPATLWVLLGGSFLLLTPAFYYSLYQETNSIQETSSSWSPKPGVWVGGGAVFSLIGSVIFLNPMTHYIAGLYLLQQFRQPTTSPPACNTN